jgi:MazG family protein
MISESLSIDGDFRREPLGGIAKGRIVHVLGRMQPIQDLRATMARLRSPGGCPWDLEQTHHSLTETLVEETAELLEAIDREDFPHMCEELGDVLLQVVFHAQMASEAGHFDFDDVARGINDKLLRRHPHVFGDLALADTDAVLANWEMIKAAERAGQAPRETVLKALPPRLPALLFARDTYQQIRRAELEAVLPEGLADSADVSGDATEAEVGEALFALVACAREAGIDPEAALRRFTQQLIDRVEHGSVAQ